MPLTSVDPRVTALLRHYVERLRRRPAIEALVSQAGLTAPEGAMQLQVGLVDATAHLLLRRRSQVEEDAWMAAWRAHGLLRADGSETFAGCLVIPALVWGRPRPRLVGLTLAALRDPRGLELVGDWSSLTVVPLTSPRPPLALHCCSDPFDAVVLRRHGAHAIAARIAEPMASDRARLASLLRRVRPRQIWITCAATRVGRVMRDAWLAAALAEGLPVEVVELPPGCGVRDVAWLEGPAAVADLAARGGRWHPRSPTLAQAAPRPAALPCWSHAPTPIAADLTAYVRHLVARGHQPAECDRRAKALAVLWRFTVHAGIGTSGAIGPRELERFQADLARAPAREAAARSRGATIRIVAAVRGFLTWAARTGRVPTDSGAALTPLRRPAVPPVLVLTEAELERALEAIPDRRPGGLRDRAILEVLYSTGIRRGELVALDVADLDPSRGVLRVRRGKGGRARLVPIGRRASAWTQRYVETARARHLREVAEPALFISARGRRLGVKMVTARMHGCLRAAGITKPGSCHVIRHSVATLMHDAGADIRDLQALLGHAALTSTQLYTRVSVQRLLDVHRRTHPSETRHATGSSVTVPPAR